MSDDSDDELLANLLASANDNDIPPKSDTLQQTNSMCSDDEDLANLLASANDDDFDIPPKSGTSQKTNPTALKELDFNFLDNISTDNEDQIVNNQSQKSCTTEDKKPDFYRDDHGNSSDDEDKKYFEKQQYSEYGREIKNLLKSKEAEKKDSGFKICFTKESFSSPSSNINKVPKTDSPANSTSPSLSKSFKAVAPKNDKYSLQVQGVQGSPNNSVKKDVYRDPIFGLKIVTPLVSSAELTEKMEGRKAVTVSNVKLHLTQQSLGQIEDWVIAGVLMSKSDTKTSQKGSQYCIWKISDLSSDMKTVAVFLFSNAYKNFWKLTPGAVIGILNPSVLETRDDRDLATLSVDNPHRIMVLGTSRDLGKCKARKKNGDSCTNPVNLSVCEFCVFHVKQEYSKFAKRTELQSIAPKNFFGNPKEEKKSSLSSLASSQVRHPNALPFTPILAKRNEKLYKKDCERLAMLRGDVKLSEKNISTTPVIKKKEVVTIESSPGQAKKDAKRLSVLREWGAANNIELPVIENKNEFKLSLPAPRLGAGARNGIIDFSSPVSKDQVNKAKQSAIEWAKKIGGIKKSNPNKVRPTKEESNDKGVKRKREEEQGELIKEEIIKKEKLVKTRFQEMLEKKSSHSDLIEKRQDEETEEYFKKLEVKERMEEKMLTTYKVDCKAVHCSICKYTAFSRSDLCKKLQHRIKVIEAVKRFFKCGDCGYRTISLDRIPTETCNRCASSKWVKTTMMDEKRTQLANSKLCIRGGEEKFIGSAVTDASLNLLVPETE